MIKIKNKENNIICSNCNTELIYENEDIIMNKNVFGIYCPACDQFIKIKDRWKFPDDFYLFGDGAKISDEKITDMASSIEKSLRNSEEEYDYHYTATGDAIVFGFKDEDGITIYVAKNYYQIDLD